jgi:hypothetical protein
VPTASRLPAHPDLSAHVELVFQIEDLLLTAVAAFMLRHAEALLSQLNIIGRTWAATIVPGDSGAE